MNKRIVENIGNAGLALVKPSVLRWISQQRNANYPVSKEEVKKYLKMTDTGFGLATQEGDLLMQDFVNFVIKSKVEWFDVRVEIVLSKLGKIGILFKGYKDFTVVLGHINYDFDKSFSHNIKNLCGLVVKNLNYMFKNQMDFNEQCANRIKMAREHGDSVIYFGNALSEVLFKNIIKESVEDEDDFIAYFKDDMGLCRKFYTLLDMAYGYYWEKFDVEDVEEFSDKYDAGDRAEYFYDLEDMTDLNDLCYNYFYSVYDYFCLQGAGRGYAISVINVLCWLYLKDRYDNPNRESTFKERLYS